MRHLLATVTVLAVCAVTACSPARSAGTDAAAAGGAASPVTSAAAPSPSMPATPGEDTPDDAAPAPEPITIVWESYNYGTQGVGGAGTQQLIDAFEASHPHIRVQPVGTPAGEIHTSVQAQAAAGDPPDVAQIGWSKFGFLLENLPYVPLEEVAPADELAAHLDGLYPAAVDLGRVDGQLVGLPYTISMPTVFLNVDLFRQAGLDPTAPPTTWDEAHQAALAIVEIGAQGIYVDAANEAKSDFLTQTLINSAGGRLLGEDGSLGLDSPEAVEAMTMLGELSASGAQPAVGQAEAIALFEAGQLGMLVTSTALLAGLVDTSDGVFELDTAPLPAFADRPVGPTVSGAGLFVFAEDGPRRDAAWELVRFFTSAEGFTIVTESIGYLPLRPSLIDDPDHLAPYFAADDRLLPTIAQLDGLVPYQVLPGRDGDRVRELIQDEAVAPIMLSGADPQPTLERVADRARELLDG